MKKASSVKLSLRKLLTAMLAVGPLAILPSPVWAALPSTTLGTTVSVTNGSASISTSGVNGAGTAVITTSDRAVLVWTAGGLNIATGETFNFSVPSGGAVLNKVGYTTGGALAAADTATIAGTLISTGKVFILANGNILVQGGSSVNTAGGLVLSTLNESSDFSFTTTGNLSFAPSVASVGSITIGNNTQVAGTRPSIAGNLSAWSNTLNLAGASVSGDLILRQVGVGTGLNVSNTTDTNVVGGLDVSTSNGAITQTGGLIVGNLTNIATNGNVAVTLGAGTNDFSNITVSAGTGTGGQVTLTDANNINIGASTIGQNLTVTAVGNITTAAAVATGNTVSLSSTGAGNVTFANGSTAGVSVNATTANGFVTISAPTGNLTVGTVTAGGIAAAAPVNITAGNGTVTLNGTITTVGNITASGTSVNQTATGVIAGSAVTTTVALTASAGNVGLNANAAANSFSVSATGGSISQDSTKVITSAIAGSTFNAGTTGNVSLTGANAFAAGSTLGLTGNNVSVNNTLNTIIANATTTGNLTINTTVSGVAGTGTVTLGVGSGTNSSRITVGGGLTISTKAAAITDDPDLNINVFGATNLNSFDPAVPANGAAITFSAALNPAGRSFANYGQINASAGNGAVTLHEMQTLNVGNITTTGAFTANSTSANVIFSGNVNVTGAFVGNAASGSISQNGGGTGTITALGTTSMRTANGGSLVLDNTSNSFTGTVTVINGNNSLIVSGQSITVTPGNVTTGSLTINSVGATANTVTVSGGNATDIRINSAGKVVLTNLLVRNLTINAGDTSATAVTQAGNPFQQMNGTLSITSAGNVTLNQQNATASNNITGSIILNVTGDTSLSSSRGLTVSGVNRGNLTLLAGANNNAGNNTPSANSFAGTWGIALGNLNVTSLTAEARNGSNNLALDGISGTIAQTSGSKLHSENALMVATYGADIVLANAGNNAGRVSLFTGNTGAGFGTVAPGNGTITYSEDGTAKLGNLATLKNATVTSRFGGIIEDPTAADDFTVGGTLALSAVNGSVLIGDTTHTAGATTGNVVAATILASGAAAIQSSGNLTLGATSANSLTVRSTGGWIMQSAPLSIFGLTTVRASTSITLNDAANNFGPLALTSDTVHNAISVSEAGTLNLRSVTMPATGNSSATFTATSLNGDIIDSGLGGVRPGGIIGGNGAGVVTLSAANGNITIDDPTSDFPTNGGIVFNAKNVTLSVLGSGGTNLALGANTTSSVTAGNLTATSALGSIVNAGNLTVGGAAFFQTGAGNISLNQSGNQFGTVRFVGNQVSINQANDMKLVTGSSAIGAAQFASGGNISVVNTGGGAISFGSTVSFAATGSITLPKLIQAANTLTVNAAGTKDLSALSISGDLSSRTPVNLGTGTYLAPQP